MQPTVLLFPHTALRRSMLTAFAPLFRPVTVLAPPSLAREAESPAYGGLVEVLRPGAPGADAAGDGRAKRVAGLLRQWEQWVRQQQGTGQVEAIKAGMEPPPPPENVRSVMREIKQFGQDQAGQGQPPEVDADLFLHLAHVHDREAADLEQALDGFEGVRQTMEHTLGKDLADHTPEEYEGRTLEVLPPLDYSMPEDHLLGRRLEAWATLYDQAQDQEAWLATASGPAARLLMERANTRLAPAQADLRSPAGAVAPFVLPLPPAGPDSPQAQEVAQLAWPDLAGLDGAALEALAARLAETGALSGPAGQMNEALGLLAAAPWGPNTAAQAAAAARQAAEGYAQALAAAGAQAPLRRRLSIVAFPGLSRGQVTGLMAGRDDELPPAEDWPDGWPDGACPLLLAW